MEELYIPLKAIEAMPSDVDLIELGAGRYMGMQCRNIEKMAIMLEWLEWPTHQEIEWKLSEKLVIKYLVNNSIIVRNQWL